ncbi:MAG: cobalamin biosynthesis protein [Candidatus Thermoplasmatota archaeon]|jgi:adenosylcobinamide-phosphate synthase|nr:cobalamin biosynthesis protein [Candidatus Thermoplasmatota archaeon]MCL5790665.1 cobalamin biosynthesis protein [Candidatus Thermoplasmatota archaeon]
MEIDLFKIALEGFLVALTIDLVFGEPRGFFHIAVISGKLSERISRAVIEKHRSEIAGFAVLLSVLLIIVIPLMILFDFLYTFPDIFILFILLFSIFLKSTFALTSMGKHIRPVIRSLENDDIGSARFHLSMCVRRNTSELDREAICSAAIETIGEGITDSFVGSLFMYGIFSIPGAIIYRIVNTMDSMFGYRDEKYLHFGKPAALSDTILNYIPARISAILIYASAFLLNYNMRKTRLRNVIYSIQSRNAAYSIGSMAVVLNVRLEKKGKYIVNRTGFPPDVTEVKRSLNIFYLSFVLMTLFIFLPLLAIFSIFVWPYVPFIFLLKFPL